MLYMVFAGMTYYPGGGATDYVTTLFDKKTACALAKLMVEDEDVHSAVEWAQVFAIEPMNPSVAEIIFRSPGNL